MLNEQVEFNSIGVVEINFLSVFRWNVAIILVISILRDNADFVGREFFNDSFNNSCFSGTCSAGNSNDEHESKFLY